MQKKYELLVFDWDGTLADSVTAITESISRAVNEMKYPPVSAETARHIVGMGLNDALHYLAPGLKPEDIEPMAALYRKYYFELAQDIKLFSGAEQGLKKLKAAGVKLAVATGKNRRGLDHAFEVSKTAHFFELSHTADEARPKPDPLMLHMILEETGVSKDRALMIGDTTHDLGMAQNAGIDALAVCYGAHDIEKLNEYPYIYMAHNLDEMMSKLLELI